MNTIKVILSIMMCGFFTVASSQTTGVLPDVNQPEGTFTEWQKVKVSFEEADGTFEYRIAFAGKKGLDCHFNVEIKNTSEIGLKFKVEYSYFDKFVKSIYTETLEERAKPGKGFTGNLMSQGAKKEKGSEKSDLQICLDCQFSYVIRVYK